MKKIDLQDSVKPINPNEIKAFLNKFDLKLPQNYIDFILSNNGGYPSLSAYDNPYEDGFVVDMFYSISLEDDEFDKNIKIISSKEVIQTHQILEHNIPKYLYPFGSEESGGELCISTRKKDFGEIYLVYLDGTCEEPVYLCDSFEEFINNLGDLQIYSEEEDY